MTLFSLLILSSVLRDEEFFAPMAIIGDALRQAFMPKRQYENLREEEKAWGKLQKPLVATLVALIGLAIFVCTIISLNIVFPHDIGNRPFCSDRRLQALPVIGKGGESDHLLGAFYLTNQEIVDYYWMLVFIPSVFAFLASAVYLVAGTRSSFFVLSISR